MTYYGQGLDRLDKIAHAIEAHARALDRIASSFDRWVTLQEKQAKPVLTKGN